MQMLAYGRAVAEAKDAEVAALREKIEELRSAGREYLQARYHECRSSAAYKTAKDNFSDGGEREQKAFVAAAIKASEAEKRLGALVFDAPPVIDAALAKERP
jgi:hypothetical protein